MCPKHLLEFPVLQLPGKLRDAIEDQQHRRPLGITEFIADDFSADYGLNSQLLVEFTRERLGGGFPVLDLPSREFPFQLVARARPSLADEDFAVPFNDGRNHEQQAGAHEYRA